MSKKIRNVLFICMGNTSRSPAAEGIAKALKRDKYSTELKDVKFDSAGFFNIYKTAQQRSIDYVKENWNYDLTGFKGKLMDEDLLNKQDLILAMQTRHLKRLKRKFKNLPNLDKKAHRLLEYADFDGELDIEDPVNFNDKIYRQLMQEVEKGVVKSIEKIIEINNNT